MSLPVRVVVIVGSAAVSALGGVWAGVVGSVEIRRAQKQIDAQTAIYSERYDRHLNAIDETNQKLKVLGVAQDRALHEVIYRMRDYLKRHKKQVRANEHLILDGLDNANRPVVGLARLPQDAVSWVRGIVGSAAAGVATSGAAKAAISRFGSATTGNALANLYGAAAQKATQAWWGGGSIASGGGGMALGKYVQYAPLIGPAVLVAGLAVKLEGSNAKTAAEQHRVELEVEIANLDDRDAFLRAVQARALEVEGVLIRMIDEAIVAIDALEAATSKEGIPPGAFQRAIILVTSVRDLATAPMTNEKGQLDERTGELVLRFRDTNAKASDD